MYLQVTVVCTGTRTEIAPFSLFIKKMQQFAYRDV